MANFDIHIKLTFEWADFCSHAPFNSMNSKNNSLFRSDDILTPSDDCGQFSRNHDIHLQRSWFFAHILIWTNRIQKMNHRAPSRAKSVSQVLIIYFLNRTTLESHEARKSSSIFFIFMNRTTPEQSEAWQSSHSFSFSWIELPLSHAMRGGKVLLFHFF